MGLEAAENPEARFPLPAGDARMPGAALQET